MATVEVPVVVGPSTLEIVVTELLCAGTVDMSHERVHRHILGPPRVAQDGRAAFRVVPVCLQMPADEVPMWKNVVADEGGQRGASQRNRRVTCPARPHVFFQSDDP